MRYLGAHENIVTLEDLFSNEVRAMTMLSRPLRHRRRDMIDRIIRIKLSRQRSLIDRPRVMEEVPVASVRVGSPDLCSTTASSFPLG